MSREPPPGSEQDDAALVRHDVDPPLGRAQPQAYTLGAGGHPFAGSQQERHVPPPVAVHPEASRDERVGRGVGGDAVQVAIALELDQGDGETPYGQRGSSGSTWELEID